MTTKELFDQIQPIQVTQLNPENKYIFKLNINSHISRDRLRHYCEQFKKLLEEEGIYNIIIVPTYKDIFDFEIIESSQNL